MDPDAEEQRKLLNDASRVVEAQAYQMKLALDNNKLMDALKHCSDMLCELRTSLLSPTSYYSLFIQVMDEMRHMESHLLDMHRQEEKVSDLYELVQYTGNIVPRLYLLITVGAVFIKTFEAPAADILRDLVEMCKGVQHPTRGLFLRHYLSSLTKDKLPDVGNEYEGTVESSINFTIQNFTEMNKLWVRLGYQGALGSREMRNKYRAQLRQLIYSNMERLGNLEGVTQDVYIENVLPRVLEQVVSCRDKLAQESLTEAVIQSFPGSYHIATLSRFLEAIGELVPEVDVKSLIVSLIDRLAGFAASDEGSLPKDLDVFGIFSSEIASIMESREGMPLEDVLSLQVSLLNLTLQCYPERTENVDAVLGYCGQVLAASGVDRSSVTPAITKEVAKLLHIPVDTYGDMRTVLDLANYKDLIQYLGHAERSVTAQYIASAVLKGHTPLATVEHAQDLLHMIACLLTDEDDAPDASEVDAEDFAEEQTLVARLIHLITSPVADVQFQLYVVSRQAFGKGGPSRIKYTLPPLAFGALRLTQRYKAAGLAGDDEMWEKKVLKVFKFVHQTITALASEEPELGLRLFLAAAATADTCGLEAIAYEFVSRAFTIYEEDINDNKAQQAAMALIVGGLQAMGRRSLDEDSYETAAAKATAHSSRLMLVSDQAHGVCRASHLFWTNGPDEDSAVATLELTPVRDGERVLQCLKKSLKIAAKCMDAVEQVGLYVDILEECLLYVDSGNEAVTAKYVNGLVQLIRSNLGNLESPTLPLCRSGPTDDDDGVWAAIEL
ncbi:vacuolar protein sorting-associated protein 35 [Thecamonas trahens ATCC 50062]|uniref:Vacuolar protein sorting-associated protein 35 n=1 Tax=Thecamonas trahens ATCC 50062 TaxID=461836 RepID=A0A0L0DQ38_THETB|nr:vacuolar protein sorting-associated protein 35 [Thecamonas trahens ATCC 50062]KNC54417.1 vacuolar protein sorting-associated protein 35 [Thecamonas trahens ATCC 50062]|eukprot:XP_013753713.1 vacuolar protein sorting-associated protein 35 [Thecamonas trahens ATCC 50062]